jgi:hypothetical protein
MKKPEKCRYAAIRTEDATYDRVAVVSESDNNMIVEFPKSTGNKGNPWKIVRNIIPKDRLVKVRYYKD